MKLEHGLELEKIKAAEKEKLGEFGKAAAGGAARVYHIRREKRGEEKTSSFRRLYGTVQGLNERMKNWKGM
jgi:hypothetical protein